MSTRSDIVNAARAVFQAGGAPSFSIRAVAARVGLTPMAIYRHFDNKQALLDALVVEAIEEWRRRVAAIPAAAPAEWLRKMSEAYLEFALRTPRKYEAAFLTPSPTALRYPDEVVGGRSSAVSLQLTLLQELAVSRGASRTTAAEMLIIITGLSQGLVTLYRAGRIAGGEKRFRALYKRAMERCVRSLVEEV